MLMLFRGCDLAQLTCWHQHNNKILYAHVGPPPYPGLSTLLACRYDYGSSFLEVNHGGACMCGAVNCISKRRAQQAGTQAAAAGAVVIEEDS